MASHVTTSAGGSVLNHRAKCCWLFWFSRYLQACRAVLLGLSTFVKLAPTSIPNPCINPDMELPELVVSNLDVAAGFTLTDQNDPRYQKVLMWRQNFSQVVLKAASALRNIARGEDHTDAVIGVTRALDAYLLGYAVTRSDFDSLQKSYGQAREWVRSLAILTSGSKIILSLNRSWAKQRDNSRHVYLKRAQFYHTGRVYMHSLYRRRSETDDRMLSELVELALSPYTRVRRWNWPILNENNIDILNRQAQTVLHNATGVDTHLLSGATCPDPNF